MKPAFMPNGTGILPRLRTRLVAAEWGLGSLAVAAG